MDASLDSDEIQLSLVPKKFTLMHFKLYTGTVEPVEHFLYFR